MKFMVITATVVAILEAGCQNIKQDWSAPFSFKMSMTPPEIQEEAVKSMLARLLPNHHHLFEVAVDPSLGPATKETFRILSPSFNNQSTVSIVGTTGVTASAGILYFLKEYCNSHISWEASRIDIPITLPKAQVKISTNDRFRYYQNVCTSSYSFVWWSWSEWEKHIDWMALNGINFPLAFTGQEAIWRRVYLELNFTTADLDRHFTGPAFLAWGRMGNIKSWGGPLSESWHRDTLHLQKKILRRMRDFGMIPILPAFAGHVPDAVTRIYPDANVTRLPAWGKFTNSSLTGTILLDSRDPLFSKIGKMFILEMIKEYNSTDHYYNCDTFNEMIPPSSDPDYLREVGSSIFSAMIEADPKAVWVMQGWMFRKEFWTNNASKALLTSVPQGKMIVLDLFAESLPHFIRLKSFYGQPFIFCMLHDFGGVDGMYGNVEMLLKNLKYARNYPNVTLIGIGITPEGINQNYVMYDLMLEMAWRKQQFSYVKWAGDYSHRRYGNLCPKTLAKAWKLLIKSIYNCAFPYEFHGKPNYIARRPTMSLKSKLWYNVKYIVEAWDLFITAARKGINRNLLTSNKLNKPHVNSINWSPLIGLDDAGPFPETFKHDLVDLTRQMLQIYGGILAMDIKRAYRRRSLQNVRKFGSEMITLLTDLDNILLSSKDFLLGTWLKQARERAHNEEEGDQYVTNALHQLTLWGPTGEIHDYAIKQWNGIVGKYMKPRWQLYISQLEVCLLNGNKFNQTAFNSLVFEEIEKPFAAGVHQTFHEKAEGDSIEMAIQIYEKYRGKFVIQKRSILSIWRKTTFMPNLN